ncbi:MAG TPA: translocation/assembly module TamB domain-containing protein, partial [Polyangia bacterium]
LKVGVELDGDVQEPSLRLTVDLDHLKTPQVDGLSSSIRVLARSRETRLDASAAVRDARLLQVAGTVGLPLERLLRGGDLGEPPVELTGTFTRFDLAKLSAAAPSFGRLQGILTGGVRVQGRLQHPEGHAGATVANAVLGGVPFARLDVRADTSGPAGRIVVAAASADQQKGGRLRLTARVDRAPGGPVEAQLTATGLDVAFVRALVPQVRTAAGQLDAKIAVRGPRDQPRVTGVVALARGQLGVVGVQELDHIELRARVSPTRITLDQLDARSGSGSVHADGFVGLRGTLPTALAARLKTSDLPVPYAGLAGARLDLDVTAKGALQGRDFNLDVGVQRGLVKVQKLGGGRALQKTGPLADVVFVDQRARAAAPQPKQYILPERINVKLRVADFYVRGKDVNADFRADLTVHTERGVTLIKGEVLARYGQVELFGRQYTLDHARVLFNGRPQPDPALDIRLTRQFPEVNLAIAVTGTVGKPHLKLTSDPALYQEPQLVSMVLTGSAPGAPSQGGDVTNAVAAGIATAVIGQLAAQIAPSLPFDVLRVARGSPEKTQAEQNKFAAGTE